MLIKNIFKVTLTSLLLMVAMAVSAQGDIVGPPMPPPLEEKKQDPPPQPAAAPATTTTTVPPIILPPDPIQPRKKKTQAPGLTTGIGATADTAAAYATIITDTATAVQYTGPVNPFDLSFRIDNAPAALLSTSAVSPTGNPFDIASGAERPSKTTTDKAKPVRRVWKPLAAESGKRTVFYVVIAMLALMAVGISLNRGILNNLYQAMLYDNTLKIVFRDRTAAQTLPYYLLFIIFIFNAGIFAYLYILQHNIPFAANHLHAIGLCVGGMGLFFGGKQILLWLMGKILPLEKELSYYRFIILIFCIISGLLLALANFFAAYASPDWADLVFWGTLAAIGVLFALRLLRSVFVAAPLIGSYFFHFCLYLCAVEIAPIIVIVKFLQNYTGI